MYKRLETKYFITNRNFHYLRSTLAHLLDYDPKSTDKGYSVTSLYFDSPDFESFYEKEDGLLNKKKLRLRLYNSDLDTLRLQEKIKEGPISFKKNLPHDYPHVLHPKLLVHYNRLAFQSKDLRVTLDYDIGFAKSYHPSDIFQRNSSYLKSDTILMEIKSGQGNSFNELNLIINRLELKSTTYSKYASGVKMIYGL